MLAAKDIFTSTHFTVNVMPDSTYLLTCKHSEDNGASAGSKKGLTMSQRVIFHNESSSQILMQAEERKAFKLVSSRADLVICWYDTGSLSRNPAGNIFKDTVDRLAAKKVNVQVNVVSAMEHLLSWMRYTGTEYLRAISSLGRLRIIVSCDAQNAQDDPEALNVLLCLSQIPVLASTPIFVQCKKPPASIANLDNVVFVTDPRKLVSMATVAAKQPELFSPSVLRKSLRPAGDLAASLLEKETPTKVETNTDPGTKTPPLLSVTPASGGTQSSPALAAAPSEKPKEIANSLTPPLTVTDDKGQKSSVTASPGRQPLAPPRYPPPHPPGSKAKDRESNSDSEGDAKGSESS